MIRISAGTAACMNLKNIKTEVYPTTAYLLLGEGCMMNCSFCSQSRSNFGSLSRLGRVTWPQFSQEDLNKGLKQAEDGKIKRLCLQGVRQGDNQDSLIEKVKEIKKNSTLPLCISAWIKNPHEAEKLFAAGADRISIALDVVNQDAYSRIKGGSFKERFELLLDCAQRWRGRISTHIIIGLEETEKEAVSLINKLLKEDITIALFAFTPIKGTPLSRVLSPDIRTYRRIQAALFLLKNGYVNFSSISFSKGVLTDFGIQTTKLRQYLQGGEAFLTSGCPDCNRPFYNESPGRVLYNYPRPLTSEEEKNAIDCVIYTLEEEVEVARNLALNT